MGSLGDDSAIILLTMRMNDSSGLDVGTNGGSDRRRTLNELR